MSVLQLTSTLNTLQLSRLLEGTDQGTLKKCVISGGSRVLGSLASGDVEDDARGGTGPRLLSTMLRDRTVPRLPVKGLRLTGVRC